MSASMLAREVKVVESSPRAGRMIIKFYALLLLINNCIYDGGISHIIPTVEVRKYNQHSYCTHPKQKRAASGDYL